MKILHLLYFLPLPFSQKRCSVWNVCLESSIRRTLQNIQYLSKSRHLRVLTLVNTYFYEHTSLRSWAILLRSVSLLILKVTLANLAALVWVSNTFKTSLGLSLLKYFVASVPLFCFHPAHLHCCLTPFILILNWPNLNLKVEQQICCESKSCILCIFRAMSQFDFSY